MKKFINRHTVLGLLAFALAALALLSLCFAVVRIDFASAMNGVGGVSDVLDSYGVATASESGFDLLGGSSRILALFREFETGIISSAGISRSPADLLWLEVFSQVYDIILLVVSLVGCLIAAGWIFFGKREEVVENLAIVVAILSALYLAQGLIFSLLLEAEWQILLDEVAGSSLQFYGKLFDTLVYVPFILVVVFEVAFWMVNNKWKAAEAPSRKARSAAEEEKTDAPAGHDAQMQMFERLRMLKQLYDEGALTEQEYEEQKMKLLGSGE